MIAVRPKYGGVCLGHSMSNKVSLNSKFILILSSKHIENIITINPNPNSKWMYTYKNPLVSKSVCYIISVWIVIQNNFIAKYNYYKSKFKMDVYL
jgi:hypothetical protein